MLRRIGLVAIVALAQACCGGPTPTPAVSPTAGAGSPLGVDNGTTVPVWVAVNGTVVETVPAGETRFRVPDVLPARPWAIDARSPSGRILATLTVSAADEISTTSSLGVSEDLACGRLVLWAGGPIPTQPKVSHASPQPCD
jgi:hypothetical protein